MNAYSYTIITAHKKKNCKSDSQKSDEITESVKSAVNEYIIWQKSKIARDVNPDYLRYKMIQSGAKRVQIEDIEYQKIEETQIAVVEIEVTYGGIEDD